MRSVVVVVAAFGLGSVGLVGQVSGPTGTFQVSSNWGTGLQGAITVMSPVGVPNWSLAFDWPQNITSAWDAIQTSHVGNHYVFTGPSWAPSLVAGQPASFGFVATAVGTLADPTNASLNGVPCSMNGVASGAGGSPGGGCGSAPPIQPPQATSGPLGPKRIVGYFPAWAVYARNYHVPNIPAGLLSHVNYAFANISSAGLIELGDSYADVDRFYPGDSWAPGALRGSFHQLQLMKTAHPAVKTLISVGGWTWSSRFSDVALTQASRQLFAASVVQFLVQYGFDGVDLDWEYPVSGGLPSNTYRAQDKSNFTLLLAELRAQLNAQGALTGKTYLLTFAAPAGPAIYANFEMNLVHQYVDWINLLSYDFHGGWESTTNFNAPLHASPNDPNPDPVVRTQFNADSAAAAWLGAGVPAAKLNLGVPFYGRGWSGVPAQNGGLYQTSTGLPAGSFEPGVFDYKDLAQNHVPVSVRTWDTAADVPWLYNAATGVMITYDDPQSIAAKTAYVQSHGLGGVMIWELSGDTAQSALLSTIWNGLAVPQLWIQAATSGNGIGDFYFRAGGIPAGTDNVIVLASATPAVLGPGTGPLVGFVPDALFSTLLATPPTPLGVTHFPANASPYSAAPLIWPPCTGAAFAGQVFDIGAIAYSFTTGIVSQSGIVRLNW